MKKLVTILAALALLLVGTAAFAADTARVDVSAQVLGTCQYNAVSPTVALNFGSFTVPALANVNATATVNVVCTAGVNWNITALPAGPYALSSGALPPIPYTFGYAPAAGAGTGANQPVTITGQILQANLGAGVAAGTYTQTVTLTLNP